MASQAEKMPAYMHPKNGLGPEAADGVRFRPKGEVWYDGYDDLPIMYIANGFGFFEGTNGEVVREHPEHTLHPGIQNWAKGDWYTDYANAKTFWDFYELSRKLFVHVLEQKGCQVDTVRIGKEGSKKARIEIMRVTGFNAKALHALKSIIEAKKKNLGKEELDKEIEEIMSQTQLDLGRKQLDAAKRQLTEMVNFATASGLTREVIDNLYQETDGSGSEECLKTFQALIEAEIAKLSAPPEQNVEAEEEADNIVDLGNGDFLDLKTGERFRKDAPEEIVTIAEAEIPEELKKPDERFEIKDEDQARWLASKIRKSQLAINAAKIEKKEAAGNCDVIVGREERNIDGLKWRFKFSMLDWLKNALPKKQDGSYKVLSHVFPKAAIKLVKTESLVCVDKEKFNAWWHTMCDPLNDDERQVYPHTVKYSMNKTQIREALDAGLEIPGYAIATQLDDWEVTSVKPKKVKGAKKGEEEETVAVQDEAEDEDNEDNEDAA